MHRTPLQAIPLPQNYVEAPMLLSKVAQCGDADAVDGRNPKQPPGM